MGELGRRLGKEKVKDFQNRFDEICDQYQAKAISQGYYGDLIFKKENGWMVIFVTIE
jgi:hypothetical protein